MTLSRFLFLMLLLVATPAAAQHFPKLTGRVVDTAGLLTPDQQAALSQKLEALEKTTSRQLVVATVPGLEGYPIEDYGYKLGRAWGIGQKGVNNGTILLVAKNDRKVRIEAGYGVEPVLTDAFDEGVIQDQILPAFRRNDYTGGINAGVDSIIAQLQAPPDQAEQKAVQAADQRTRSHHRSGSFIPLIFWGVILLFMFGPMLRRGHGGRRFGSAFPIFLWGSGLGGGWGSGGSSGGGFGGFSGGGGGFSGGGGSFGGGGASGGW
jgi:uncharacterized protein